MNPTLYKFWIAAGVTNFQDEDLRHIDLQYTDLSGANLQRADLRFANLRHTDFKGANLRGADLRYADLQGADLRYADLQGADLRYADLQGADLLGTDLRDTQFNQPMFSLQLGRWNIFFHAPYLTIGCQTHRLSAWKYFTNREIARMHPEALKFWDTYKTRILALCDSYENSDPHFI